MPLFSISESKWCTNSRSRPCKNFQKWFRKHRFYDLHFTGPKFTWKRGSLYKHLDRAICNDIWFNTFNKARVFHLPRLGYDHQPILLSLNNEGTGNKILKPFRFLASWLTDNCFSSFVSQVWKKDVDYNVSVKEFTDKIDHWNKNEFGNIFKWKRKILARLGGIQKALESYHSDNILNLETHLSEELNDTLNQEELLWL